jgi:hypothetical protein
VASSGEVRFEGLGQLEQLGARIGLGAHGARR